MLIEVTITAIILLILRSFQKRGRAIVAQRLKALPLHTNIFYRVKSKTLEMLPL